LFLLGPEERKFYAFGHSFGGKLRRLTACRDRVDNLWGQKRQPSAIVARNARRRLCAPQVQQLTAPDL